MTDDMNQSKRKPWTHDPEVLKQVWGEKAELPEAKPTASQRLVLQRGSIWPTNDELDAYQANALPDSHTFTRAPIAPSEGVAKPQYHTPIADKLAEVKVVDSTQQLIDSVLATKEAKDTSGPILVLAPEPEPEPEPIVVPVTHTAVRIKEAKERMQELLNKHKA